MATILPAVPGLMRLDLDWATQSKNWSTALHLLHTLTSPYSSADFSSIFTALASAVTSDILPLFGANTVSTGFKATDLTSSTGLMEVDEGVGSGTGTGTHPLPINNTIRTTYLPPLRYRGGRPGNSWSGLDMADQETGSATMWSTATHAAWQSGVVELLSALTGLSVPSGGTVSPVTVSYFTGHALRPTPLTFQIALGAVETQQRVCSKRRRLGRGVPGE